MHCRGPEKCSLLSASAVSIRMVLTAWDDGNSPWALSRRLFWSEGVIEGTRKMLRVFFKKVPPGSLTRINFAFETPYVAVFIRLIPRSGLFNILVAGPGNEQTVHMWPFSWQTCPYLNILSISCLDYPVPHGSSSAVKHGVAHSLMIRWAKFSRITAVLATFQDLVLGSHRPPAAFSSRWIRRSSQPTSRETWSPSR